MQSPSFGLLSLFSVEPNLAMPAGAGAEAELSESGLSFLTRLTELLPQTAISEQELPLMLQQMADNSQHLPLEQLSVEQLDSLNTLLAQFGMGDLALLPPQTADGAPLALQRLITKGNNFEQGELIETGDLASTEEIETAIEKTTEIAIETPIFSFANQQVVVQASQQTSSQINASQMPHETASVNSGTLAQSDISVTSGEQNYATEEAMDEAAEFLNSDVEAEADLKELSGQSVGTAHTAQLSASSPAGSESVSSVVAVAANSTSSSTGASNPIHLDAEVQELEGLENSRLEKNLDFAKNPQQWGGVLASRVVAMIKDDVQQARIHLDPPELGSLQIKLQIQHQQATIQVQAQHAQVREVLETQAFRLRESLAEQGLELAGFDVSSQDQQHSQQQNEQLAQSSHADQQGTSSAEGGDWLQDDENLTPIVTKAHSVNLLDTFA